MDFKEMYLVADRVEIKAYKLYVFRKNLDKKHYD